MSTPPLTAAVRTVRAIIEGAEAAGVPQRQLLSAAGLEEAVLADVDGRVPYADLAAIWREGARLTGDDAFGIHVAERIPPGGFGVLEYVVYSSPDLGTAFDAVCRYFRLLVDGVDVQFEVSGDTARFVHRFPVGARPPRHAQEFVFACLVVYGRRAAGVEWVPSYVAFPHPAPADTAEHLRLFRAPLFWERPAAEIVFPRDVLRTNLARADEKLLSILQRHANELLAGLPDDGGAVDQVRGLLMQRLRGTTPSLEELGRALGMSPRTLQRRLKDEGTTLLAVVDDVRHELAVRYLQDEAMAISEVAFLLGFSEPSAFHRAFRRWTGLTPAEFRRRAA